jgi:hypothetical protein
MPRMVKPTMLPSSLRLPATPSYAASADESLTIERVDGESLLNDGSSKGNAIAVKKSHLDARAKALRLTIL